MPKQSREQIIAELEARKVGYTENMSYNELCELLKQAHDAQRNEEIQAMRPEENAPPQVEEPIDYTNIRCGLSTIQYLHRRITLLERAIKK